MGIINLLLFCQTIEGKSLYGNNSKRQLYDNKLDTLSLGERISLKTNFVDWIALIPNLGAEITLGNMNWNRWTIGIYGRLNPSTHTLQTSYHVYDLSDIRFEVRRYHHGRGVLRSFFMGVYGAYGSHNLKWSTTGYKGNHLATGLTVGTLAPLYSFVNGGSLDLEFSLNAGAVFTKHEEYEKVDNTYVVTKSASNYKLNWSPLPYLLINDVLKVSLVYHFGPSVANRYKKRITIDERYRYHLDELKMQRDSANLARQHDKEMRRDSLEKLDYERRFEKQRLELERKYLNDSISQIKKQKAAETKRRGKEK